MKKKWYLQTWFIVLMFFFSLFGIAFCTPIGLIILILDIILIILQAQNNNKLLSTYGKYDDVVKKIAELEEEWRCGQNLGPTKS